jgi:hypothetical protein
MMRGATRVASAPARGSQVKNEQRGGTARASTGRARPQEKTRPPISTARPPYSCSGRSTCRLMAPSLVAVGTYALLLAWNEYLYAFLLLSKDTDITLAVGLGNFLAADDSPWELLMATGLIYALPPRRDLLHLPPLHGGRADRRRGEELIPSGDFELRNPAGPRSAARRPFPRGICAGFQRTPSPATRPAVADRLCPPSTAW